MLQRYKDSEFNSQYYYEQLNASIEASLSYEQKEDFKRVLKQAVKVPSKKIVSMEITFWFFKRFYAVFYLGHDRRTNRRKPAASSAEFSLRLLLTTAIYLILWGATAVVVFFVVYYTKSVLGIDIYPEQHLQQLISG